MIFGLALFNFFYIYSHIPSTVKSDGKISFYYPNWYGTSDFADAMILLLAAFLLLFNRKWNYFVAGTLSGIIVVEGLIQYVFRVSLLDVWKYVQRNNLDIFLQWEMQFFFAIIIFSFALFYLIQKLICKNNLK